MSFNDVYAFSTSKHITVKLCGTGAMAETQSIFFPAFFSVSSHLSPDYSFLALSFYYRIYFLSLVTLPFCIYSLCLAKSLCENSIDISDTNFNAIICVNCTRDEELCAFNAAKEKKLPFFLLNAKGCQGRIFVWYPIPSTRQPSISECALPKLCQSILVVSEIFYIIIHYSFIILF